MRCVHACPAGADRAELSGAVHRSGLGGSSGRSNETLGPARMGGAYARLPGGDEGMPGLFRHL